MKQINPDVSIIIPIYNTEMHLRKCLDSVIRQSMSSFEVLLIDDGSTDHSAEIAKSYLCDKRFKYFRQSNSGVSAARNNGIEKAQGNWIAFIDSDDSVHDDYLECLLNEANDNYDIISCGAECEEGGRTYPVQFYYCDIVFQDDTSPDPHIIVGKRELYLELLNAQYGATSHRITAIGVPWGKLYRSSFLKQCHLTFNTNLKRFQDNIFNMYAFDKARCIRYIDRSLYIYRADHIFGFRVKYDEKMPECYTLFFNLQRDFLVDKGLLTDCQIIKEFSFEVIRFSDAMLQQYYLHCDNPLDWKSLVTALRERFDDELYYKAFREKTSRLNGVGPNIRIWFLKKRKYRMLIIFERVRRQLRRLASRNSLGGGYSLNLITLTSFYDESEVRYAA